MGVFLVLSFLAVIVIYLLPSRAWSACWLRASASCRALFPPDVRITHPSLRPIRSWFSDLFSLGQIVALFLGCVRLVRYR